MAEELLHDNHATLSGITLVPSSGGVYEITLGDRLIFSKKATGKFPDPDEVKQAVAAD